MVIVSVKLCWLFTNPGPPYCIHSKCGPQLENFGDPCVGIYIDCVPVVSKSFPQSNLTVDSWSQAKVNGKMTNRKKKQDNIVESRQP